MLAVSSAVVAIVVLPAPDATAHPLGNFTVNHYTGLLIGPERARIDHVIDLAEIPTAQLGDQVDDLPAVAETECSGIAAGLHLRVAGSEVPLRITRSAARLGTGQYGLGVLRVECLLVGDYSPLTTGTAVTLRDEIGGGVGWREIVANGDRTSVTESNVPSESTSDRLADYPRDLLSSPLDQRSAKLVVSPGGPAALLDSGVDAPFGTQASSWFEARTAQVVDLLGGAGPGTLLLVVLAALILGAAHAVAPGHGKTLMAFYLVDRPERSLRAALAVGTSVTVAHTASVVVLGILVATGASVVPDRIYPVLTAVSGLLVLAVGATLLWRLVRGHSHDHGHDHRHDHGHGHRHDHDGEHVHSHDEVHVRDHERAPAGATASRQADVAVAVVDRVPADGPGAGTTSAHQHMPADAAVVKPRGTDRFSFAGRGPGRWGGLVTIGLAGGILPSPSALLLLLGAVALGRPWLGAMLVLAFGIGMAVTLCAAGLMASTIVDTIQRRLPSGGRLARVARYGVSYGAVGGVCVVGVGLIVRGAVSF